MIENSKILSANMCHARIDWYVVHGKLYFVEITFFDGSGFALFDEIEMDLFLGNLI
jgi:hypothetical protein